MPELCNNRVVDRLDVVVDKGRHHSSLAAAAAATATMPKFMDALVVPAFCDRAPHHELVVCP